MKIKLTNSTDAELMGMFGLSWKEKVAAKMIAILAGTEYEDAAKSFWGPSGKNTSLVKSLHVVYTRYMTEGNEPPVPTEAITSTYTSYLVKNISFETGIPTEVVTAFLIAMYDLVQVGQIEYKLYNPMGYKKSIESAEQAKPKTGINLFAEQAGDTLNKVIIIGGLAVGAYLLTNINKLRKG